MTNYLSSVLHFDCVCDFIGLFRRRNQDHGDEICMVLSHCSGGDLFSWVDARRSRLCAHREINVLPIASSVLSAVQNLHSLGFAHGDLSLENVLLVCDESDQD